MESETAHIWKKIELFYIQCFFFCLFADDDVKMNYLELHYIKSFDISVSVKKLY